jgi:hypothetical protein
MPKKTSSPKKTTDPEPMGEITRSYVTPHHEAAHAVVNYRACGHAGGTISTEPNQERGFLGCAQDFVSDSFNTDHIEARILSCYAGGHAQRRVDPEEGDNGCETDDAIASDLLYQFEWESREPMLRARAGELVNTHWTEIVAVASELLGEKESR